jgi:hypothetical protein
MYSFETAAWTTMADLTGLGACYDRSRLIKTDSALNLPYEEWSEVFCSERLTGALLDRLLIMSTSWR